MASLAVFSFAGVADEVKLNVVDATDIDGTYFAEVPASSTGNGTGAHYQPLNSLKISGWSFKFSKNTGTTEPAFYYPMSTNTTGKASVRIYKSNTATIVAPAGTKFNKVVVVPDNSTSATTVYSGEAVSEFTLTAPGTVRINEITITTGEGSATPDPEPEGVKVVKTSELTLGQIAFVFNEGYINTFAENKTYGYWMATPMTIADEMTVAKEAIFTIEKTDKGYTIKDCYGRYMGRSGTYWSFNSYATPDEGKSYWDIVMVNGTAKISNKVDTNVYMCGKTYSGQYEMALTDADNMALPFIYKVSGNSGVADVIVEENMPVVYYNLQGVKVANPDKGIFIRVQGNKTSKVVF